MSETKIDTSRIGSVCKDDAGKWALAFVQTFPECGVDEGTMLGWFANAIEVAHDHRMNRLEGAPLQDPDPVAAIDTIYEHMGLFEGRLQALEESVRFLKPKHKYKL